MQKSTYYSVPFEGRTKLIEKMSIFLGWQSEVVFAFLFGSFAREPLFRDIDVGVFVEDLSTFSYHSYEDQLALQIERDLDWSIPVEVRVINRAPLSFCFGVVSGKLLFARNEKLLNDFMTDIARKYLDFAPLRYRYIKEAIA